MIDEKYTLLTIAAFCSVFSLAALTAALLLSQFIIISMLLLTNSVVCGAVSVLAYQEFKNDYT